MYLAILHLRNGWVLSDPNDLICVVDAYDVVFLSSAEDLKTTYHALDRYPFPFRIPVTNQWKTARRVRHRKPAAGAVLYPVCETDVRNM